MRIIDEFSQGGINLDNGATHYRRFLEGDETAFDAILELYFDNLTFFINRYVHDLPTAEDLAIDTMLELMVHTHRYNFSASLKTYLFTIGRNKALSWLRRHRRVVYVEPEALCEQGSDLHDLEDAILQSERERVVSAALGQLPQDLREAVHLVYFEGMSYDEAGRVMKKNRKQIDNLLYRAKDKLRTIIGKDGKDLL